MVYNYLIYFMNLLKKKKKKPSLEKTIADRLVLTLGLVRVTVVKVGGIEVIKLQLLFNGLEMIPNTSITSHRRFGFATAGFSRL